MQRAASECGPLDETAAEAPRELAGPVGQTSRVECRPRHVDRPLEEVEPCRQREVFQQGQVVVEQGLVGEESNGPTGVVGASAERLSQQADLARGRPHQAGQEPQQCRLAGPVWADDRQGLTRPE